MEICDEATAKFMGESLLGHAREINRYATVYCAQSSANQAIDDAHKRKFAKTVVRMIHEMRSLMLMAKYKGISRYCNHEQIEAYIDGAKMAIAAPAARYDRQSAPQLN